jgi:hypothetical protein
MGVYVPACPFRVFWGVETLIRVGFQYSTQPSPLKEVLIQHLFYFFGVHGENP